jgi:glycerol uptake facilitator
MGTFGMLAASIDNGRLFWGEVVGTGVLILLGDGVVAGVLLGRSKAQNSGWIVITWAWAMGVLFGVWTSVAVGGQGDLNPAVTIGKWASSRGLYAPGGGAGFEQVVIQIVGEFIGAFAGAILVYLAYLPHWSETEDKGLKLAVFSTGPAIRNSVANLITEIIGTFMLVFGVFALFIATPFTGGAVPAYFAFFGVALLVFAIGMSLGGPTGYAINPARDLGPRIIHAILPIPGKGSSDWAYSWIPVVGPIIGGILGAWAGRAVFL